MTCPYTYSELKAMKTLAVGQVDDLKAEDGRRRYWISRTPNVREITIEEYDGHRWNLVETIQA